MAEAGIKKPLPGSTEVDLGVEQLDAKAFTQQFAANMLDVGLDAMACLQSVFNILFMIVSIITSLIIVFTIRSILVV